MEESIRAESSALFRARAVTARIAAAATRVGRDPCEVRLLAATKNRTVQEIQEVVATGAVWGLGENRVQEACLKIDLLGEMPFPGIGWHMIGRLQTNKVGLLAGKVQMIHSVDRLRLVEAIARSCPDIPVLIQVSLAGEQEKGGVLPAEVELLCRTALERGLAVRGFMTMPPKGGEKIARPVFRELRELRDRCAAALGVALPELSMGMSRDMECAVEEGSTIVRVGKDLFAPSSEDLQITG